MKFEVISRKLNELIRHFINFILIIICFEGIAKNSFPKQIVGHNPNDSLVYKEISFGEKIDFGNIESTARWTIANYQENSAVSLSGSQINDYIFEKPGIYEISFSENGEQSEEK